MAVGGMTSLTMCRKSRAKGRVAEALDLFQVTTASNHQTTAQLGHAGMVSPSTQASGISSQCS